MKQQKGFVNSKIALIVLVVILAGITSYFVFVVKKFSEVTQQDFTAPINTQSNNQSPQPFPVAPATQQTTPAVDEIKNWSEFVNRKYNYSFKHPQGDYVSSNQFATGEEESFNVSLRSKTTRFNVEAQDPEMYSGSPNIMQTMNLDLRAFTDEIWKQNKEDANANIRNKEVGPIFQTTVSGKVAYQFTLTDSYNDESGGYVLYKKYVYLFVENKGLNFMIWLPIDDVTAQKILQTFKFLN